MRHLTDEPRCAACGMRQKLCLCAVLPRVATRTHVAVLMHGMEHRKTTNTGRLALRVLENSALRLYGNDLPPLPVPLPAPPGHRAAVLFPSGQPIQSLRDDGDPRPVFLVALDATWRQAVKLRAHFGEQQLPFVHVNDVAGGPSRYGLRTPSHARELSTLEAIARALLVLEDGPAAHDALVDALRRMVDRTLWLRGAKTADEVHGGLPPGLPRSPGARPP